MIITENTINLSGTKFILFELGMNFFVHSVNDSSRNMHSAYHTA